jgi:hypothetical protein
VELETLETESLSLVMVISRSWNQELAAFGFASRKILCISISLTKVLLTKVPAIFARCSFPARTALL